eukprot:TRINITY_DN17278_c0_g1_i11.p1 TRINITY_DN17278_c0_g1~~TRINITY_DN17278_c0_g1_i11.p1  ORF type:complete len:134 (+),score=36.73 TRINITY_DN17278_c0_g1_i11:21-422(+)
MKWESFSLRFFLFFKKGNFKVCSSLEIDHVGIIQWSAYISTSDDKNRALEFSIPSSQVIGNNDKGMVFEIKGRSGRDIQEYSSIKTEREILISPNTRFVVIKKTLSNEILRGMMVACVNVKLFEILPEGDFLF